MEAIMVTATLEQVSTSQYSIDNVTTISRALAKLNSQSYDAIILDLTLPDSQGLESLNQIRSVDKLTPIIVLTGTDDDEVTNRAIQYGAQDFIHKEEFNVKVLNRSIRYAIERKKQELELQQIVQNDVLTALSNRILFMDRLEHTLLNNTRRDNDHHVVVMLLDLDNFKNINDNYGHSIGDALLIQVANRLKNAIRKSDTLARLGGDEFTVLIDDVQQLDAIGAVTNKIIQSLSAPFIIDNKPLFTACSIGVSSTADSESVSAETLLKNADIAMYNAKNNGGNQVKFFTKDLQVGVEVRNNLEKNLRNAIERDELKIYFQPQMNITNNRLSGAEALLRWQHPELGIVSPDTFIPILEETGLINTATDWIIEETLKKWQNWQSQGLIDNDAKIGINLSPKYFRNHNCSVELDSLCKQFEVNPNQITFEITENVLMDIGPRNLNNLNNLHDKGFKIAIDDFGTGYSSLQYLKAFPIDCIKLDRLFVADLMHSDKDMAIAEAIIQLCKRIDIDLIAEGISDEETLQHLKQKGCNNIQGFHISKPLPEDKFTEYLKELKKSNKIQ